MRVRFVAINASTRVSMLTQGNIDLVDVPTLRTFFSEWADELRQDNS
jgi:hypothetical protein